MRTVITRALTAAVMIVGMAVTAPSALADSAGGDGSAERHCLVQLEQPAKGEKYAQMSALRCFSSQEQVRAEIARGNRSGAGILATLIGTDYTDPSYGGSSLNWTAPGGCFYNGGRTSWSAPSMPAGWDNVVSSTRTYSNCKATLLYDLTNYGGISMVTGCNSPALSFMDNRASSREWTDQTYGQPC